MSAANPILVWQSALLGTTATTQSGSITVTVNITNNWEVHIPVAISWKSGVSADGVVNAYMSHDGGATYDTNPSFSTSVARVTAGKGVTPIILPTGQYALQILNSGPSTGSASIGTYEIITAIQNL